MKIYRPLWEDGAFLAPQQFQQQTQWDAYVTDTVARMGLAHPWGVIAAEFDDAGLALSRLNATRIVVRFPDGTLVNTDLADNLPPVCDLSAASGQDTVEVLLALPLLSANGGNLDNGQDSDRPRRWKAERAQVQELAGTERGELAVLRYALTLRLASQENTAYLTCPVTRLARNAQGVWSRDPSFIPPLLSLSASPALVMALGDLLQRLQARRQRLMAMRRESNERMADFAVADVSLFWLLNALNSAEPVLTELLQEPARHPELLYRELARLAGSLLTFSLEHDAGDIPAWRHHAPEQVFPPLLTLLDRLLEASLPSRVISIQLEHEEQMWKGALHDARLREGADFYLSVRSSMPNHALQVRFPQLCKAGSFDDVSDVVNVALSGMVIKPLSHVPAAIPLRLENQYFSLDLTTDAARAMLEAGSCTFYTPRSLGEVKLELYAVLRT
ncbi:type VI secretion system baseplate subunit TssK [Erwinia endophytica]|uniref:type VI secretion system baseplate subunit TssK n=1 Tax=Erwinia endophytica TaxID=1563158 RepID=UPI001265E229|nr:type VI secretion system baseplate subunit TssK [Erwinia endophytica]KAB8313417.1 type VI secretion system baseplate subunit TssK [Erwinia endophytica]